MFFILSKVLGWVLMPLGLITISTIVALVFRRKKLGKIGLVVSVTLFFFFTNPLLATLVMNTWEPPAKEYQEIKKVYDVGIVLAGISVPNRAPFDRIQFAKGADRIIHAIDLYKLGQIKKILISGGSGALTYKGIPESHMLWAFTINMGVPARDVVIEDLSRNTRENALYSSEMVQPDDQVLLITSAFHMYRSSACFDKVNVKHDTFPTDYYGDEIRLSLNIFIPQIYAIELWTKLSKELLGILAYKLAGYI